MFASEAAMQAWLTKEISQVYGLGELIAPKSLDGYTGEEKRIAESYSYCIDCLNYNYPISFDENISLKSGDILRPDVLLYSSESETIVLVELKNIKEPTRQAGTELSAYAAELRSYIPLLASSDIISVIISTEWPTLLRHYVFNEITWHQRKILCLKPVQDKTKISLEIVDPKEITEGNLSLSIADDHLSGFHICLYDMGLYSGGDIKRLDSHVQQMLTALRYIAAKGTSQGNNGFAFLWRNSHPETIAPYMITVVNIAPFSTLERFLRIVDEIKPESILGRFINICAEHDPTGHGASLGTQSESAMEFLGSFCSPQAEGFMNWRHLKEFMLENGDLIAFQAWGFFETEYFSLLKNEYNEGKVTTTAHDPNLGLRVLEKIIDSEYQFIDLTYFNYHPEEPD
ncbi:hypothetical protein ACPESN_15155 [Stutzerimonas marianensis]|uniref:hypothetical protein n=1 Tax=Stutzerimonas marianensis TaxID=2929513 RepID=UPI003C2BD5B5